MNWITLYHNQAAEFGVLISEDSSEVLTYIRPRYRVSFLTHEILPALVAAHAGMPIPKSYLTAKLYSFRGKPHAVTKLVPEVRFTEWGTTLVFAYQDEFFSFAPFEIKAILDYLATNDISVARATT